MAFSLPPLPYAADALSPHMSETTLRLHHGQHHAGYVAKLNELVAGTPFEKMTLEEVVLNASGNPENASIFNNAAQAWNHSFFWNCMRGDGGGAPPSGPLSRQIEASIGGPAAFKEKFIEVALGQFGSGWVWLIADAGGELDVVATSNADTPLAEGKRCILTCDLWEHAYYLDHQNRREEFVRVFLDKLANWRHAEARYQEVG